MCWYTKEIKFKPTQYGSIIEVYIKAKKISFRAKVHKLPNLLSL